MAFPFGGMDKDHPHRPQSGWRRPSHDPEELNRDWEDAAKPKFRARLRAERESKGRSASDDDGWDPDV